MYLYVPDSVGSNPPVLVAVHYCTRSGPAFHEAIRFFGLDQPGSPATWRPFSDDSPWNTPVPENTPIDQEYRQNKHYIAKKLKVLNGYSYQVFNQAAT